MAHFSLFISINGKQKFLLGLFYLCEWFNQRVFNKHFKCVWYSPYTCTIKTCSQEIRPRERTLSEHRAKWESRRYCWDFKTIGPDDRDWGKGASGRLWKITKLNTKKKMASGKNKSSLSPLPRLCCWIPKENRIRWAMCTILSYPF